MRLFAAALLLMISAAACTDSGREIILATREPDATATAQPVIDEPSPTPQPPPPTVAPQEIPTDIPPAPTTAPQQLVPPPPPPPAPAVQQPAQSASYPCETSDCDCGDFPTHAEAQRVFDAHGGGNWSKLDGDGDGSVCESLP